MFLIGLSLYQLTRLWFDDLSNFNLFYNVQDSKAIAKDKYFIKPDTLAVYNLNEVGKGYSWIKQNKKEFDDTFFKSANLIKAVLAKGKIEPASVEELWQKQNVLFKYDYEIEPSLLLRDLNVKNLSFNENVQPFNEIMIMLLSHTSAKVYFMNDKDYDNIVAYTVSGDESIGILKQGMDDLRGKDFPYYQSSKELNLSSFTRNVLIPDIKSVEFNTIDLSKPFYKDDSLDEAALKTYVNGFSKYNKFKLSINDENDDKLTYIDVDDGVQLDYYLNGYVAYRSDKNSNKKNVSPVDAYYKAEDFIKNRDTLIKDVEYTLAHYVIEEDKVTFYYKYKFNGIDVDIAEEKLQAVDINLKYPIEIIIEDGHITHYKRYLLNEVRNESNVQKEEYTLSYSDVIDHMIEDHPDEKGRNIEDVSFKYLLDSEDQILQLSWVVTTDNIKYTQTIN